MNLRTHKRRAAAGMARRFAAGPGKQHGNVIAIGWRYGFPLIILWRPA